MSNDKNHFEPEPYYISNYFTPSSERQPAKTVSKYHTNRILYIIPDPVIEKLIASSEHYLKYAARPFSSIGEVSSKDFPILLNAVATDKQDATFLKHAARIKAITLYREKLISSFIEAERINLYKKRSYPKNAYIIDDRALTKYELEAVLRKLSSTNEKPSLVCFLTDTHKAPDSVHFLLLAEGIEYLPIKVIS